MSRRNIARCSYKPPRSPRTTKSDKITEETSWLRFDTPMESMYSLFPQLMGHRISSEIPTHINGFEINKLTNKKIKYVIMHLKNGNVTAENMCVNFKVLHKEEYFDAIEGYEEELKAIGCFTETELKRHIIDDPTKIFKFEIGNKISINCTQSETIICGSITQIQYPKYYPQMKPPYFFTADHDTDSEHNGWVFEAMINTSETYETITFSDIISHRLLNCIEAKDERYISSTFLSNLSPFIDIMTPYFGHKKDYLHFESISFNPNNYRPKCVTYQYLKDSITKCLSLKTDTSVTDLKTTNISANPNSCLLFGSFIDRYSMHKLLFHLRSDNIDNIIYSFASIKWKLSLEFCTDVLGISNIILKNADESQIVFSPNKKIHMTYSRDRSVLLVQKYSYFAESRDIVRLRNESQNGI